MQQPSLHTIKRFATLLAQNNVATSNCEFIYYNLLLYKLGYIMHYCTHAFLFLKGAVVIKLFMNSELNRTCLKE